MRAHRTVSVICVVDDRLPQVIFLFLACTKCHRTRHIGANKHIYHHHTVSDGARHCMCQVLGILNFMFRNIIRSYSVRKREAYSVLRTYVSNVKFSSGINFQTKMNEHDVNIEHRRLVCPCSGQHLKLFAELESRRRR